MITLLLVCIFFGINVRVYLNFQNMQAVAEVILPFNLSVISLRLNLHNQTLYYNINKGKVRQISINKSDNKAKKQFKPIRIDKVSYSLVVGSNDDCLKGLYISNIIDYLSGIIADFSKKYIQINKLEKVVIPNFNINETKLVVNVVIGKGIIDIIKNIFAKKEKNNYEVKYAN